MRNTANIADHHRLEKWSEHQHAESIEEAEITGWTVVFDSGEVVGEVEELLFNPLSGKVRYLVLDLDDACVTVKCEKALIPIGLAEIHAAEDIVVLKGVGYGHLERLPAYAYQQVDDEMEIAIRLVFGPTTHEEFAEPITDGFYEQDHFNIERLYQNRKRNG